MWRRVGRELGSGRQDKDQRGLRVIHSIVLFVFFFLLSIKDDKIFQEV